MATLKQSLKRLLRPLRLMAGRFVLPERNFIGAHGCLQTAASFTAWNEVEGDYLEFGVFKGDSFAAAFEAIESSRRGLPRTPGDTAEYRAFLNRPVRYFAFDSFAGLPPGEVERHADYAPGAYQCTEARFRTNVAEAGVDMARVITVPGFYDQSLKPEVKQRHQLRRAAVVMIDCDLYESTVPVLDFLTDIVGQGTVLIFHDWFRFKGSPQCGEQRACREWLARNPRFECIEYWREGPQAVSFIVNFK